MISFRTVRFLGQYLRQFGFIMMISAMMVMPALSQDTGNSGVNLGVIDMNDVIRRSSAMATIRATLNEENINFQTGISADELRLRQEERDLNSLRDTLSEADFQTRLGEFEQDVQALQQSIQVQKSNFDRSIQQAQAQLEQELRNIISEIAQERQLAMVFQQQAVVLYNTPLDITNEALERLNERTKNIKVTKRPNTTTQ